MAAQPHPNVARIRFAALDNYTPYLWLDYVPGGDLWTFVGASRRLTVAECWWVLVNITEGMGFLYEKYRIIHRDLKPQNLLVDADGYIRIADFGLAKSTRSEATLRAAAPDDVVSADPDPDYGYTPIHGT